MMKTAIIFHGNLRTFSMPLRECPGEQIATRFKKHLVAPNDADVFVFTDTNDFFHDGVQYYPADRKIEILNDDSCRIHKNVDFIEHDRAHDIVKNKLQDLLRHHLKVLHIEPPYDPKTDSRYSQLYEANVIGSSPSLLIHQWRKLKLCYEMFKEYASSTQTQYDILIKWRFDIFIPDHPLQISNYDFNNTDIYTAGGEFPIIYDWYAFGKQCAIEEYMYLYDKLGCFLHEGRAYMFDCKHCKMRSHYGAKDNRPCQRCGNNDMNCYEITLAPEYHLFRLLKDLKIRESRYGAYPYRYRTPDIRTPINEVIKALGVKNVTVVNHTASRDSGTTKYED